MPELASLLTTILGVNHGLAFTVISSVRFAFWQSLV